MSVFDLIREEIKKIYELSNAIWVYMKREKTRMTSEQEERLCEVLDDEDAFCALIDDFVAEGVDISQPGENGLTMMEAVYEMHYGVNPDDTYVRLKYLLDYCANPNINSYTADDELSEADRQNVSSSLLHRVMCDRPTCPRGNHFGEQEERWLAWLDIVNLLTEEGARLWRGDYVPWDEQRADGYVAVIRPTQEYNVLFVDNANRWIGTDEYIEIRDENGKETCMDIQEVAGLKAWQEEYQHNCHNLAYDWQSWKERGRVIARALAAQLPPGIALYYLNDCKAVVEKDPGDPAPDATRLCRSGKPIRIYKP